MVTYEIKVTFKTEGECIYRKNEAEIPRIPYWSRYTEGGRVYGEDYIIVPAELPHKKRWLRHDLYYKAYHVEYLSHRMVQGDELYSPPNQDYLDRLVRIINPLPGESLVELWGFVEPGQPRIHHTVRLYFRFGENDGVIYAELEKREEEHFYYVRGSEPHKHIRVDV